MDRELECVFDQFLRYSEDCLKGDKPIDFGVSGLEAPTSSR